MTREEARKMWPIVKAFSEGEAVEYRNKPNDEWFNLGGMNELSFDSSPECYRVKSEPKYRPFNSVEECWQEMQKHQPYVRHKNNPDSYKAILLLLDTEIWFANDGYCSYNWAFEHYTFADGTPFGVKEDGDE